MRKCGSILALTGIHKWYGSKKEKEGEEKAPLVLLLKNNLSVPERLFFKIWNQWLSSGRIAACPDTKFVVASYEPNTHEKNSNNRKKS